MKCLLFSVFLSFCLFFSISFASDYQIYQSSYRGSALDVFDLFWKNELIKIDTIDSDSVIKNNFNNIRTVLSSATNGENIRIRFENKNSQTTDNLQVYCEVGFSYSLNNNDLTEIPPYTRYRLALYTNNLPAFDYNYNYFNSNYTSNNSVSYKGDLSYSQNNKYIWYFRLNNQWYYFKTNNSYFNSDYDLDNLSTFDFIPLTSTIKTIDNIPFFIQNFTRYSTNFKIGELSNFNYQQNYHGVCALLINGELKESNVSLFINSIGEVFVYTSNLLFNQGYVFKFYNGDQETDNIYFYFIPLGSSSGDISGDSYVYDGVDNNDLVPIANIIDSQYIVNSGELYGIIDNNLFPSGDLSLITDAYNFNGYTNSYFDLLYNFYRNILTTLTGSGNVQLPISYRNFNMILNSNDYYVPDSPIKTLVTTILIVWCIFLIYQDLDKQFRHIRQFELGRFLHDTDVDYHMFL